MRKLTSSRLLYGLCGLFATTATALIINLLAAALQQRAFLDQFSEQTMWIFVALAVLGSLGGYWLGEKLKLAPTPSPLPASTSPTAPTPPDTVTMTRLRALLSYARLKGQGIHLTDILLIGSRIDIES